MPAVAEARAAAVVAEEALVAEAAVAVEAEAEAVEAEEAVAEAEAVEAVVGRRRRRRWWRRRCAHVNRPEHERVIRAVIRVVAVAVKVNS